MLIVLPALKAPYSSSMGSSHSPITNTPGRRPGLSCGVPSGRGKISENPAHLFASSASFATLRKNLSSLSLSPSLSLSKSFDDVNDWVNDEEWVDSKVHIASRR